MSTRPRITFDEQGRCNACQWAEEKRHSTGRLADNRVDAVATAHLLNFMDNGLARARELAIGGGINLPRF